MIGTSIGAYRITAELGAGGVGEVYRARDTKLDRDVRPRGLPKTGGRVKGTPNKRSMDVAERLEKLGVDPIEGMALLASDENNTAELRGRMYSELAQYLYPKRKAIELSPGGRSEDGDFTLEELLRTYRKCTQEASGDA